MGASDKNRKRLKKPFVLKLYVTGATRRSQQAINNLSAICEEHLKGGYDLEVMDIYQSPGSAKDAGVVVAPTLVKQLPRPVRWMVGDLSERGRVLLLLGLTPERARHA